MKRLNKAEISAHLKAEDLLQQDVLATPDKTFVLTHWQPRYTHPDTEIGALFTPPSLAHAFTLEVGIVGSVIDLCAGIGSLAYAIHRNHQLVARPGTRAPRIVCVEREADFIRVGRKILPEAQWIHASVFNLPADLAGFDVAVSNPPYGNITRDGAGPRYAGAECEYHVVDIASTLARRGVFILPQASLGWAYSGRERYQQQLVPRHERFVDDSGIELEAGCGIDCSALTEDWQRAVPQVEVAKADFTPLVHDLHGCELNLASTDSALTQEVA